MDCKDDWCDRDADVAHGTLQHYCAQRYGKPLELRGCVPDAEMAVKDLMVDLMHYCQRAETDFDTLYHQAAEQFVSERDEFGVLPDGPAREEGA